MKLGFENAGLYKGTGIVNWAGVRNLFKGGFLALLLCVGTAALMESPASLVGAVALWAAVPYIALGWVTMVILAVLTGRR